ncbi:hypothetical protein GLOTRDRAFT_110969 [Gloeophyllum trabeum ATCC 11539]|uniref:Uncharacterized protein n=1 Tax=Gloeophyllum trabeum (strain ATCC 11539 / FP-39264 / Madison 617) TaxID=670483 RepID=S7Q7Z6_GLOTA|nr:uncharacterized protein GLOTRDRAFT_110969 [Gloeophyllum trabeum ATCC 11539]EPQ55652.1 hypothetical protein GLOTRDRAFT_110969 [Gloeophyllum trabeum ATCC 11539]
MGKSSNNLYTRVKGVFRRDGQPAAKHREYSVAHQYQYSPLDMQHANGVKAYPTALHHQDDLITEFFGGKPKGPRGYY